MIGVSIHTQMYINKLNKIQRNHKFNAFSSINKKSHKMFENLQKET